MARARARTDSVRRVEVVVAVVRHGLLQRGLKVPVVRHVKRVKPVQILLQRPVCVVTGGLGRRAGAICCLGGGFRRTIAAVDCGAVSPSRRRRRLRRHRRRAAGRHRRRDVTTAGTTRPTVRRARCRRALRARVVVVAIHEVRLPNEVRAEEVALPERRLVHLARHEAEPRVGELRVELQQPHGHVDAPLKVKHEAHVVRYWRREAAQEGVKCGDLCRVARRGEPLTCGRRSTASTRAPAPRR